MNHWHLSSVGHRPAARKSRTSKMYGPVCQSGGGGLVAALIAERSEVLCAVSSSGATAVKHRILAAGRNSDYTGKSMAEIWDPFGHAPRLCLLPIIVAANTSAPITSPVPNNSVGCGRWPKAASIAIAETGTQLMNRIPVVIPRSRIPRL